MSNLPAVMQPDMSALMGMATPLPASEFDQEASSSGSVVQIKFINKMVNGAYPMERVEGGQSTDLGSSVDVVILRAHSRGYRTSYDGNWDANRDYKTNPPKVVCKSFDGEKPAPGYPKNDGAQSPAVMLDRAGGGMVPSTNCNQCELRRNKHCKFNRDLVVADPDLENLALVSLSSKAVAAPGADQSLGHEAYKQWLGNFKIGTQPIRQYHVVTRMHTALDQHVYARFGLAADAAGKPRILTQDQMLKVLELQKSDEVQRMLEYNITEWDSAEGGMSEAQFETAEQESAPAPAAPAPAAPAPAAPAAPAPAAPAPAAPAPAPAEPTALEKFVADPTIAGNAEYVAYLTNTSIEPESREKWAKTSFPELWEKVTVPAPAATAAPAAPAATAAPSAPSATAAPAATAATAAPSAPAAPAASNPTDSELDSLIAGITGG